MTRNPINFAELAVSRQIYNNSKLSHIQDKVRLPVYDLSRNQGIDSMKSMTDFALLNCGNQSQIFKTKDEKKSCEYATMTTIPGESKVWVVGEDGKYFLKDIISSSRLGISPCISIDVESFYDINNNTNEICDLIEEIDGKHIIKIGQFPRNCVDEQFEFELEDMFNQGNLKDGLICTGRVYTSNGQNVKNYNYFTRKENPEFEYKGKRYVRAYTDNGGHLMTLQDGRKIKYQFVRWFNVEPISYEIRNWNELSNCLNPNGVEDGSQILELESVECVLAGIPYIGSTTKQEDYQYLISRLRCFLNSSKNSDIKFNNGNVFYDLNCDSFLEQALNENVQPIKEYKVSYQDIKMGNYALAGCVGIDKVIVPNTILSIDMNAFLKLNFKYMYLDKLTKDIYFSKTPPQDLNRFSYPVFLDTIRTAGISPNYKYNEIFKFYKAAIIGSDTEENFKKLNKLCVKLRKAKMSVLTSFIEKFFLYSDFDKWVNDSNFTFFMSEFQNLDKLFFNKTEMEIRMFLNFANALGCFSTEKILDEKGVETQTAIGQKASSVFAKIIKSGILSDINFYEMIHNLNANDKISFEFVKFISKQENNDFPNLKLLLQMEKKFEDSFFKIMMNFDDILKLRNKLTESGNVKLSYEEAFIKFLSTPQYNHVDKNNKDIAELFSLYGIEPKIYEEAIELRKIAEKHNIPRHILNVALKEKTILEQIQEVKSNTELTIDECKKLIRQISEKQFTYEMLDKRAAINYIIGSDCSCCASIKSEHYGKDIVKQTILSKFVQNIVVRNSKGEIIAKGAMYVNKDFGYAVINDFEINEKYKKHQKTGSQCGYYNVSSDDKDEIERDKIFEAFMRGIKAFVKQYNKENPARHIQTVSVGKGYNRLKKQCDRYNFTDEGLHVPARFNFEDAKDGQYILYDRVFDLDNQK